MHSIQRDGYLFPEHMSCPARVTPGLLTCSGELTVPRAHPSLVTDGHVPGAVYVSPHHFSQQPREARAMVLPSGRRTTWPVRGQYVADGEPEPGGRWLPVCGQPPWNWPGNDAGTADFEPHQIAVTPAGACLTPVRCAFTLIPAYGVIHRSRCGCRWGHRD